MKPFMDKDFLLRTPTAQELYHNFAEKMPVLDYHCHINPQEIAENRKFQNITQVWLGGDHYKWRQMRSNGVEEAYITGDAPDREKFQKWAETLEMAIGNPLFHWSHLELRRYFGYAGVLTGQTAQQVWDLCNEKLQQDSMRVRSLIERSGVTLLCTTDDPADDLHWHAVIRDDPSFAVKVLPAWRPDQAMHIEKPGFAAYMRRLGDAAGVGIHTYGDMKAALIKRLDFFDSMGCRTSDHGIQYLMYAPAPEEKLAAVFDRAMAGGQVTQQELLEYQTGFLRFIAGEYKKRGWVMQLHYGCKRDNNTPMFEKLGPDTGFDCIDNHTPAAEATDFLDALERAGALPKTVLYSLNPGDNAMIGTILGCFQNSDAVGKIQQGSAWWFNDNKAGMESQMTSLANLGLLGNFIGMLTDSRSFLSYPRHEYFRRIFCNLIGGWVEDGEFPKDMRLLEKIVKGVSYNNAVRYFGFPLETR